MFSTTIKRSAATLGVVAGLLAAAGPASAQILDGPVLAKAGPQPETGGYLATDPSREVDNQHRLSIGGAEATGFVKAPANATSVTNEAVDLMNNWVKAPAKTWTDGNNQPSHGGGNRQGATLGTQVGSEGVKDDVPLETVSFTIKGAVFRGEVIGLEPTVKAPAAGISGQEMADAVKAPASPTSEVFTSVSNVAPLHGDATTLWSATKPLGTAR